ncbi:efflux RND transporter permease subunit [Anaerostipes sp.]|uniref:efflux RND transporter permease subunit n=1 Tax=Anaerostipes sp. TaxID=1872530 RepID=UPI003FEE73F8
MISKFSVRKPYTIIVGVVLILILGIVSFSKMSTDLLPDMELPYAIVMTTYEGASPEEVETTVTKPVEQSMATINNIKEVNSVSSENMSLVILEFEGDTDMNAVSLDMREKLDMIKGYWPDKVGNPSIMKLNPDMMPVMVTAIDSKNMDTAQMSDLAQKKIEPSIEAVEGVASVSTNGLVEENINVLVSEKKINKLNKKIQKALNGQFNEAQNKLDQAKAKLESGKNTLNIKKEKANKELAKAQAALTNNQMSLAQKEVQVTGTLTNLQTQKKTVEASRRTLDKQIDQLEAKMKQVPDGAMKLQLATQVNELKKQKKTTDQTVATLNKNIASLQKALKQIQAGKKKVEAGLTQFQVKSSQANAQMLSAELNIAQGESQIKSSQKELDSSKSQAKSAADIKNKLTVENVKSMLTAQNFEMPAGYITEKNVQYLVRVGDKAESEKDLQDMELMDLGIKGIPSITLSDVADVAVVNNQDDVYCRVNGNSGVIMTIQKQNNYSTADVANRVAKKLKQLKKDNAGFHYINIMDQGVYINMVTGSVIQNLVMGAVLAVLILLLFLKDVRPTLVIACSIPLSVIFAIVLMYFTGISLNVISLSGLALGVGMLVDNSIVVIENIYRLRKEGVPVKEAAITGARGVAGAITSSTLTTVIVFLPIVFTTGITKQLFADMGLTIGYSLLASLIVAVTFVPMMSSGVLHKVQEKDVKFVDKMQAFYQKVMGKLLPKKLLVVGVTIALFAVSVFGATKIGTSLMPDMDSTQMTMTIKMPKGSSMSDTAAMTDTVMSKVRGISDVDSVAAMISSSDSTGLSSISSSGKKTTDQSSMYILLKDKKNASRLRGAFLSVREGLVLFHSLSSYSVTKYQGKPKGRNGSGRAQDL